MTEYQIQPNTRRCTATGREIQPGEKVYTVLLDREGKFIRQDYCAEAWQGPPSDAFGFWAGRVPVAEQSRRPQIDDDLLMECFQRLEGHTEAGRVHFRYVVALLLMRRKRLKFEEAKTVAGLETLCLRCVRTGKQYEVANPGLSEEAMATVQDEVFRVLGWE